MRNLLICLSVIFCVVLLTSAMIHKLEMPDELQAYFNGAKTMHNTSDVPGEQIFWECMQRVMWQMAEQMGHNVTRETRDYLDRLLQIAVDSIDTQVPRHRKEYRMLTDDERDRFHKAVRALKEDKALKPNVFSAFSELHAGEVIPMAHFGAGFPGWHRVFLLIFETALRMKDPSVSMPYWASNLDNEMEDPTMSITWSDKFLGTGEGFVTSGPFADFKVVSSDLILTRNIGTSGTLISNEGIHGILSQNHTADITSPKAPQSHNLELQHNTVHLWVGGNMDDLSTSAEDPVFYLHHAFIDYLWEEFRTRQKLLGIEPETDYPTTNWGDKYHAPDYLLGFGDLRNVDALNNVFADLVKYDPSPVCSRTRPSCGSKYLKCDTSHVQPICVSLSRDEFETVKNKEEEICVDAHLTRAIQNSFAINQYCDIRKWSYLPVKIVLQRPPEFANYKAYPVLNNRPVTDTDVFSTISINKNVSKHLAAYPKCKQTSSVVRKIFVESHGLNYYGKYKDFTVLDQRHALSTTTTYLGVKSPESNYTDVIVYAYDYCGRSCRPFCLDMKSKPPKFHPCSGVIRITPDEPKMYGDNYADAVNNVWRADHPDDLPDIAHHHACVTFYCDYSGVWPWDKTSQGKTDTIKTKTMKPKKEKLYEMKRLTKLNKKQQKNENPNIKLHNNKPTKMIKNTMKKTKVPTITIIKTKSKKISKAQPRKVRVIDLRSATRRPPVQKKVAHQGLTSPNANYNRDNTFYSNRRTLPHRRLFGHREFSTNWQQSNMVGPPIVYSQRQNDYCRLNPGCILPVPCSPCHHKSRQHCEGPSRMVAICINGVYMLEPMFFNFMG